jgi:hypothetical protein
MKNLFAFAAVAGMVALASCGGAEEAAKKMQDSINRADSLAKVQMSMDSAKAADSIKAANDANMAKMKADSTAAAWHADSVTKKLIKTPKKK